tara:strand:+ start:219 stop:371 length:153 start_codon:yes stop_codon:yes gene_type:complete
MNRNCFCSSRPTNNYRLSTRIASDAQASSGLIMQAGAAGKSSDKPESTEK